MSLHDEHLKQALQSAPDHDLAPSDAVRQKVLDYAKEARPKPVGRLRRYWNAFKQWKVKSWQLASMGTIASIFVVMLAVRPQLPDDAIWHSADIGSEEHEVASTKEQTQTMDKAPVQEEALTQNQDKAEPASIDIEIAKEPEVKAVTQPQVRAHKKQLQAKRAEQPMVLADKIDADVKPPAPVEDMAAIAEDEMPVAVESEPVMGIAEKAESRMAARQSLDDSEVALKKSDLTGAVLAKKDIQLGNFRILVAGNVWPKGQPLVDVETGFRVELTSLPAKEVNAYNQVMRSWYRDNQ